MADILQASAFLASLSGNIDAAHSFQLFDDNSDRKAGYLKKIMHGTIHERVNDLGHLNEEGAGIFVMINAGDGRGRSSENVTGIRALFIDDDHDKITTDLLHLPPSIVVKSVHGRHFYWLVDDCGLDEFSAAQKRLAAHYNTDPIIHDLPRVMRVPGFCHNKIKGGRGLGPILVTLETNEPSRRYALAELTAQLAEIKEERANLGAANFDLSDTSEAKRRYRAYLAAMPPAVEGQNGDHHTFVAACYGVNDFALSPLDALECLLEWNQRCVPPWGVKELQAKVRGAGKYAKGAHGSKLGSPRYELPGPEPKGPEPKPFGLLMTGAQYMSAWASLPDVSTVPTGIDDLDDALGGGIPATQVTQIVGGPGSRKSELARQIRSHCLAAERLVIHIDTELGVGLMATRDLSQMANIASVAVRDREGRTPEQARAIAEAERSASTWDNLRLYCGPPPDLATLDDEIRRATAGADKPCLIILDSLQQLSAGIKAKERRHEIEGFIAWANKIAQETNSAVIITSERKRKTRDEGDVISSGAESRSIEYQAAVVLVLEPVGDSTSTTAFNADQDWEQAVRLIVAKNREGQKGELPTELLFTGPTWGFKTRKKPVDKNLHRDIIIALEERGGLALRELRAVLGKGMDVVTRAVQNMVTNKEIEVTAAGRFNNKKVYTLAKSKPTPGKRQNLVDFHN